MQIRKGNVLDSNADVLLFTANCAINSRKELIMGKGSAYDFKMKYPTLPKLLGEEIKDLFYGVCIVEIDNQKVGAFQTKTEWRNPSRLEIIEYSVKRLNEWIEENEFTGKIALPYPGIGYGQLKEDEVFPLLCKLSDNVNIYKL